MKRQDPFSAYHPLVTFLYFVLVLVCTMCLLHPVSLVISLAGALCYRAALKGKENFGKGFRFVLPVALMAAICNALFGHKGATILFQLPTGSVTLESMIFGLSSGLMLSAVMVWFGCYSEVMTSDKFIFLFGRITPSLSLVLSMTLSFIPRFKKQFAVVAQTQQSMGRSISEGKLKQRIKRGVKILSIMITWSLENAIETADSMKSRGYGLPNRSTFSVYRFDGRDKLALFWLVLCGVVVLAGWAVGAISWNYYPLFTCSLTEPVTIGSQIIYLALCMTPIMLRVKEDRKWRSFKSTN